jgi:hypothetical protein
MRDITVLASFVAAGEQDEDGVSAPDEIHPITGTVVDPHLRHAAPHWLHVAGIAERESADAGGDAGARRAIS